MLNTKSCCHDETFTKRESSHLKVASGVKDGLSPFIIGVAGTKMRRKLETLRQRCTDMLGRIAQSADRKDQGPQTFIWFTQKAWRHSHKNSLGDNVGLTTYNTTSKSSAGQWCPTPPNGNMTFTSLSSHRRCTIRILTVTLNSSSGSERSR